MPVNDSVFLDGTMHWYWGKLDKPPPPPPGPRPAPRLRQKYPIEWLSVWSSWDVYPDLIFTLPSNDTFTGEISIYETSSWPEPSSWLSSALLLLGFGGFVLREAPAPKICEVILFYNSRRAALRVQWPER